MAKTDFLKQAISDATELQKVALENAKMSLIESFDPKLKSILAAKLAEEAEKDEEDVEDSKEEKKESTITEEKPVDDTDNKEGDDEKQDDSEDEVEEEYDIDAILAEMENDSEEDSKDDSEKEEKTEEVKVEDTEVTENDDADADDAEGDVDSEEKPEEDTDESSSINLEALLKELKGEDDNDDSSDSAEPEDDEKVDEEKVQFEKQISELNKKLNEVNLLNAKLLYLNKILAENEGLSESHKIKLISTFDQATNVKEVKLIHKTINEAFKLKQAKPKKTSLKESVQSFASNSAGSSDKMDKPVENQMSSLWNRIKRN